MMRTRRGFTLVELMVSAVILALVTAGVATVMSTCLSAWRAGQARSDLAQEADAIVDTLARDLRGSFLGSRGFFVSDYGTDQGRALDFTTLSRRTLRLLYLIEDDAAPAENLSDLAQVVYFTQAADQEDAFALYRWEICPPWSEPLLEEERDPEQAQLLSDRVASLDFRFHDAEDPTEPVDDWEALASSDGGGQAALPVAVEISLALSDNGRRLYRVTRVSLAMTQAGSAETATDE